MGVESARAKGKHARILVLGVMGVLFVTTQSHAEDVLPPWVDVGDVPLPEWVRSVSPNKAESAIYAEPGKIEARRGSAQPGARLPLFGTKRAAGCMGRWLNVGPLAWMCSDVADYSGEDPTSPILGTHPWLDRPSEATTFELVRPPRPGARGLPPIDPISATDDGLPYRYYFAGRDGAYGYANLATALDDSPDQDLEPGFAVAMVEERHAHGERWGRTKKGRWVQMRELAPARPNLFHGELLARDGKLDIAWVVTDRATVYGSEKIDRASGIRVRFEKVRVYEEKTTARKDVVVRVSADGERAEWMRARDLSRPRSVPPPPDVTLEANERWIDVDLKEQALIAYEGATPVFATLVSTGKGPPGSELATHPGTFRIWVKVFTTKMDNLEKAERAAERGEPDTGHHYAIEDVPWVQFFDKAIALHGAFWHRDFGHVHSHGCVNLAPLDARWLFAFTSPHLPQGWTAVLPTTMERGAVVRVR